MAVAQFPGKPATPAVPTAGFCLPRACRCVNRPAYDRIQHGDQPCLLPGFPAGLLTVLNHKKRPTSFAVGLGVKSAWRAWLYGYLESTVETALKFGLQEFSKIGFYG
jgi:hypothetical protein